MSNSEKVAASNLPVDELAELSTGELLQLCVENPLLQNLVAVENPVTGMQFYIDNINVLRTLIARPDAGELTLEYYGNMDLKSGVSAKRSPLERGLFRHKLALAEMILMQPAVLARMTKEQCEVLLLLCEERRAVRCATLRMGTEVLSVLAGRILVALNDSEWDKDMNIRITPFLEGKSRFEREFELTIFDQVRRHLEK